MKLRSMILEYLRLFRFHAVSMETTIILIGALIMGQRDLLLLSIIFLIGFFGHICGYVLNDYADIEVDKISHELREKPLVSGTIPKNNALIIAFITALLSYILVFIFFQNLQTILFLGLATVLTIVYNFLGKKIPGSDAIVAATVVVFFFMSASSLGKPLTNLVYIVGLIFLFDIIFINIVEGGLKDVDHDYLSGAKTLATVTGVKVENGKLITTGKFLAISYTIRAIYIVMIILLGFQPQINIWLSNSISSIVVGVVAVILMIIVLYGSYKFLSLKVFDRSKMKRLYGGINAASGILYIVMLYPIFALENPILGLGITLFLLLFPVTWYTVFNTILYGKPMQPRV
jgi:4-hydroxybenzoate polyprenyltransferase